jgi:hypothetical protein
MIRFFSLENMRRYIKELLDSYQRDYDKSSNVIGGLLREQGKRGDEVIRAKGWSKVGSIFVNSTDPGQGSMEIIFQLMNEMKIRVTKTEEVLRFFDLVENLPTPGDSTFLLFLRGGIPERIIVDPDVKRPEKYGYKATLKTV